jgi:aspartyl protease family protein
MGCGILVWRGDVSPAHAYIMAMDTNDFMNLAYLLLLLVAVGGWMISQGRNSLGKLAQQAIAWVLIFLGVIAAVGLWGDIRQTVMPRQSVSTDGQISVPQDSSGHYNLIAEVNGQAVYFVVDTGATNMVLSKRDAAAVGFDPAKLVYSGRANTANGEVSMAQVTLDQVSLGPVSHSNVRAMVADSDLDQSLLGMSYLRNYSRIEIVDGALILTP